MAELNRVPSPGRLLPSLALALLLGCAGAAAQAPAGHAQEAVFARVDGTAIGWGEYDAVYVNAVRQKYYHRKPPDDELAKMQREVGDGLIETVLLLNEAKRLGLKPDEAAIGREIQGYEQRYGGSPQWQQTRDTALPQIRRHLEDKSLLDQMQERGREVPPPSDEDVLAYYKANSNLFTEPEQVRVSAILLKVDPSSPRSAWEQAQEEGKRIVARLKEGADFAELAKIHSGDASAAQGGDMGYLHQGMLPEVVQGVVDKMKPGQVSEPVIVLEGVAVLKLADRKESALRPFPEVRERARDLLTKERRDKAWKEYLAGLRKNAKIEVDESRFLPLAGSGEGAGTGR